MIMSATMKGHIMDPITAAIINRARAFQAELMESDEASLEFKELVRDQFEALLREAERLAR